MLKKKFLVSEMEIEGKKIGDGFTDDSYIVIDIPSVKERLELKDKFNNAESKSEIENIELMKSFIVTISCKPIDDEQIITDFDLLSCYALGTELLTWLGSLLANGFVPKKA